MGFDLSERVAERIGVEFGGGDSVTITRQQIVREGASATTANTLQSAPCRFVACAFYPECPKPGATISKLHLLTSIDQQAFTRIP